MLSNQLQEYVQYQLENENENENEMKMPESKVWYHLPCREDPSPITMDDILDDVVNDRLFGLFKVDIHVPVEHVGRFSEFHPLSKTLKSNYRTSVNICKSFVDTLDIKLVLKDHSLAVCMLKVSCYCYHF